ncbi:MAG: ABC transporter ATP-binding protein [Candidatus Thorarchaeota archaeon]
MNPVNVISYLARYILQQRRLAVAVIIFITIGQIAELVIPLITGWTIDEIIWSLENNQFSINVVLTGAIIITLVALIRGLFYFLGRYLGYIQGERVIYEIRRDLFEQYENSSLTFFDQHHTGDLMARATTDLEPMSEFLVWGQRILLQASLTFIGVYSLLFIIDVRLFLVIGIISPSLFLLSYFVSRKLGPLYFEIRSQYGNLTTTIQESISGYQVVKAFNAEEREKEKFDQDNISYRNLRAYAFKIRSIFLPMVLFVVNLLITILIFAGGTLVIQEDISTGTLIALLTYFTMLAMPTRFLAFSLIMYQRTKAAGERVFTLLELPKEIRDENKGIVYPDEGTPTIIFEDVSFAYDTKIVLSNISLTINPGDKVAILGPTGSGKSTLVSLMPRFYDPIEGNIKIISLAESFNLKDLNIHSWRLKFGWVHQEPFLFGRSIYDNITFGIEEKVSLNDVENVARIAQVEEFVSQFHDGYDTIIGERGVTLSGGQKQRIAIARMLLRKPRIMILDDATSSVDTATESKLQRAFNEFIADSEYEHTVFLITHRLSTVKMANKIIIMNKGKIIEQGSHEELLTTGKIYQALWKTQEAGMIDLKVALEKITRELEMKTIKG